MKYRITYRKYNPSEKPSFPCSTPAKFNTYGEAKAALVNYSDCYSADIEEIGGYEPDCDWQSTHGVR